MSEQNVSRELLALWENAYVERMLGQVESRLLYKGSYPTIYGLTRKGAWLLRKNGYEVRRRLLYEIDKQRDAGWRFIEHRVEITAFMVSLQLAARGRSDVGVLDGRIVAVGNVDGSGREELDAEGHVVAPGFVDGPGVSKIA